MVAVTNITTAAQFDAAVAGGPAAVVYFWADWSAPCKHMDVVFQELAKQHPGMQFLRVEAEVMDEVTERCEVATVPYFVFYKNGHLMDRLEGADPAGLTTKAAALAQATATAVPQQQPAPASTTGAAATSTAATGAAAGGAAGDVEGRIRQLLADHSVVLFMKGNPEAPRCGFSRKTVEALHSVGAPLHTVDILQDEQLRQAVKAFSNWPTYPQLYVCGELVGGCDIIMEMHQSGELKQLLQEKLAPPPPAQPQTRQQPAQPSQQGQQQQQDVRERVEKLLSSAPCMLFMKGTPDAPRCGFSSKVVQALNEEGIPFVPFDILTDEAIRQGLKEYSSWPTYPQLYVHGELVGGCDIVMEMHKAGELKGAVEEMLHRTAA